MLYLMTALCAGQAYGQKGYAISMTDSLEAGSTSSIIYNNIKFRNNSDSAFLISVNILVPNGWRSLSACHTSVRLGAHETETLPLALIKLPNAGTIWKAVDILLNDSAAVDTQRYSFYVSAPPIRRFMIYGVSEPDLFYSKDNKQNEIALRVKNMGNEPVNYQLYFRNGNLNISDSAMILLPMGKDSTYRYPLRISGKLQQQFPKEVLNMSVKDQFGTVRDLHTTLYNVTSYRKEHLSRYNTFNLSMAGGLLSYGGDPSYFLGVSGSIPFKSDALLEFQYQSKQYGIDNQYDRNIWSATFTTKHFYLYGGQMYASRYFISYGNGFRLRKEWKGGEIGIWGVKHYNNAFNGNDNAGLSVRYRVGNAWLEHTVAANQEYIQDSKSALFDNTIQLIKSKKVNLTLGGGLGKDFYPSSFPATSQIGTSWSYLFSAVLGKWHIASDMLQNSIDYPGLYRGYVRQNQEIRWAPKSNFSLSAYYRSSTTVSRYLRDTLYNTDAFSYNSERVALRTSVGIKRMSISISGGLIRQLGLTGVLPHYGFGELNYRFATNRFSIDLGSMNGYADKNGGTEEPVFISNNNLNIAFRYAGLNLLYVRAPVYNNLDKDRLVSSYSETINVNPYINIPFTRQFSAGVNYNLSKFVSNDIVTQYLGGNISYNNVNNGLNIALNTSLPLQSAVGDNLATNYRINYFNLTFTKHFNVPIVTRRKYYSLHCRLYIDSNNNDRKDDSEAAISNSVVSINNTLFVTNNDGEVLYKNVEPGDYSIDLTRIKCIKGIIPVNGIVQTTRVERHNVVMDIPYKKSKVISGTVQVLLDSLNTEKFTPEKIKVILTDSSGKVYTTLTGSDGSFYFNVPSGIYTVSLNPKAFDDHYRPAKMSFVEDMTSKDEVAVTFQIKQRRREVRMRTVEMKQRPTTAPTATQRSTINWEH